MSEEEFLDGPTLLAQALQTRAILLDLIAELRDAPDPHEYRGNYAHDCADDAEARLREVQGE